MSRTERLLFQILTELRKLTAKGSPLMASLQDVLDAISAQKTVADSVVAWMQAEAAAAGVTPDALANLVTAVQANSAELSAAIVANTPVQPTQTTSSGAPPTT